MTTWVQFDAWHVLEEDQPADTPRVTLCGLHPDEDAPLEDELPLSDKSCETCLRLKDHAG
jgi:hypothetical protein